MSLNWNWNEKVGTWTEEHEMHDGSIKEFKYNLYSGNALLIMIAEWDEDGKDLYQVANFFCNKDHMKNCLGLSKDHTKNIFKDCLKEVELNAEYRNTPIITQHLAKASFDKDIKITIKSKAPW